MSRLFLMILLSLAVFFGTVYAQIVDGKEIVRAELVSSAEEYDKPFLIGIRFRMEPGWYLYWINPGDAGLPVEVKWNLPPGYSAGELQFPTPQKFVYDGIIAYGYKNELVLLVEIRPDPQRKLKSPILKAQLDWLVCKESCIRGGAGVELNTEGLSREQRLAVTNLLSEWRLKLPRKSSELSLKLGNVSVESHGTQQRVSIEVEGKDADVVTDFYPFPHDKIGIDFSSITVKDKRISFLFTPYDPAKTSWSLSGLLIVGDKGFECSFTVPSP
jgi:thiol:disulfide interchange protein DsbD